MTRSRLLFSCGEYTLLTYWYAPARRSSARTSSEPYHHDSITLSGEEKRISSESGGRGGKHNAKVCSHAPYLIVYKRLELKPDSISSLRKYQPGIRLTAETITRSQNHSQRSRSGQGKLNGPGIRGDLRGLHAFVPGQSEPVATNKQPIVRVKLE
jgi:hypothetical protein